MIAFWLTAMLPLWFFHLICYIQYNTKTLLYVCTWAQVHKNQKSISEISQKQQQQQQQSTVMWLSNFSTLGLPSHQIVSWFTLLLFFLVDCKTVFTCNKTTSHIYAISTLKYTYSCPKQNKGLCTRTCCYLPWLKTGSSKQKGMWPGCQWPLIVSQLSHSRVLLLFLN